MASSPTSIDVIYIAGAFRSGSTLLANVLGALPGFVSVGECALLWSASANREACGCGRPLPECPFWSEVVAAGFGSWDRMHASFGRLVERNQRHRRLPLLLAGSALEAAEALGLLYRSIVEVAGAETIVDSSKTMPHLMLLERSQAIDPSVVHLVRDPRGVAHSWTKRVRRPEVVDGEGYLRTFTPLGAAWSWTWMNAMVELARLARVPMVRVRYEDFMVSPQTELRRVLGPARATPKVLAGVEEVLGGRVELTPGHTVAGNPGRFVVGPLRLRPDEAWRSALSPRDRNTVALVGAPLLARYGYLTRSRRP
jgi:hypothetical protein